MEDKLEITINGKKEDHTEAREILKSIIEPLRNLDSATVNINIALGQNSVIVGGGGKYQAHNGKDFNR